MNRLESGKSFRRINMLAEPSYLHCGNGNGNKMNLRVEILENLLKASGDGTSAKVNSLRQAIHRSKTDMADGLSDSLDLLRQVFQAEMTDEIKQVIDRHLRTTFAPAFENLKRNGHTDISKEVINDLCLNILDAAREPFLPKRDEADRPRYCIPSGSLLRTRKQHVSPDDRKVYESDDNESDTSMASHSTYRTLQGRENNVPYEQRPKKRGRPRKTDVDTGRSGTPIMKGTSPVSLIEVCKWNPERVNNDTKFILGSKVNKLLSLGHRGHIFVKYPRIFRYVCDDEDKAWLFDRNISTRMSGKVFFMILDDVLELATIENAAPTIQTDLLKYSFHIPERVVLKMRKCMMKPFEQLKGRVMAPSPSPMQVISPLPGHTTPTFGQGLAGNVLDNMLLSQAIPQSPQGSGLLDVTKPLGFPY